MLSARSTIQSQRSSLVFITTARSASSTLPSKQALGSHSLAQSVARRSPSLRVVWMNSRQLSLSTALSPSFFPWRSHKGKVEVKCEACSSKATAVAFCRQCIVFICSTCVEAHQKPDKMFDNHQVISMVDLKEGKAKADITMKEPSAIKCKIHKKSFKVYCFDCDLLICRDCTMKGHRDHNIEFTSVAAPEMREGLMKELQPLRELIDSLTSAVEKVKSIKQEVQVQGDSVTSTIKTAFTELLQIVERCQQDLLEEAKKLVGDKEEKLSVQEKNLTIACSEVRNVVDYIERCVSHCSDNEIMSMLTIR